MEIEEIKQQIKIARNIAYSAPEINIDNFRIDDLEDLNNAMVELFNILNELDE